jgi:hypothetical protein
MRHATLHPPITTADGTFTSTVSEIDWSGGSIPVGQFGTFDVLAQGLPTGVAQLVFPTIQQYSDGTSVAWIQAANSAIPDPPHPAPVLQLTAGASSTPATTADSPASGPSIAAASTGSSGGSNALAITALILSGFGVVIALLAVWLGRPLSGKGTGADPPG